MNQFLFASQKGKINKTLLWKYPLWQLLVSSTMPSSLKEFISSSYCLWLWKRIRVSCHLPLWYLVLCVSLVGCHISSLRRIFCSFCPLSLSFRKRGNVQRDSAGENLFLEATEGKLAWEGGKIAFEKSHSDDDLAITH